MSNFTLLLLFCSLVTALNAYLTYVVLKQQQMIKRMLIVIENLQRAERGTELE